MSLSSTLAYRSGHAQALSSFGIKEAGMLSKAVGWIGRGAKWLGRAAGAVPAAGTAVNAVVGTVGGLAEGVANQGLNMKGLGEGAARAGANLATGSIPGGAGVAAGLASDIALDKAFAPKAPAGPQPQPMPGMMGSGAHLPGQAI